MTKELFETKFTTEIAKDYGVAQQTISSIKTKINWNHGGEWLKRQAHGC